MSVEKRGEKYVEAEARLVSEEDLVLEADWDTEPPLELEAATSRTVESLKPIGGDPSMSLG